MNYYRFSEYEDVKNGLIDSGESFIVSKTNYTAKLTYNDTVSMFNEDGRSNIPLLNLINKVRKHNETRVREPEVTGIDYFKLFGIPKEPVDCMKIDLSKAYWTAGMMNGIVTEEMEDMVCAIRFYDKDRRRIWNAVEIEKKRKSARLISLGSLATTKTKLVYDEGVLIERDSKTQDTKNLYLSIHKIVDDIMKDISRRYHCFYYYFDCFFTRDISVVRAIEDYGFRCTVERSRLEVDEFLGSKYIHDLITGNKYNIREEHYINIGKKI